MIKGAREGHFSASASSLCPRHGLRSDLGPWALVGLVHRVQYSRPISLALAFQSCDKCAKAWKTLGDNACPREFTE